MNNLQIIQYFENLAHNNRKVAHNRPHFDTLLGAGNRRSFLCLDDDTSFASATSTEINYPIVTLYCNTGMLDGDFENLEKQWRVTLEFLCLVNKDLYEDENTRIEDCYSRAGIIMDEFISKMINEQEENGNCGNFKTIDFTKFQFVKTGEVHDGVYGYTLRFPINFNENSLNDFEPLNWY